MWPQEESIDNGPNGNDGDDLAQVIIRQIENLPVDWSVTLALHSQGNVGPAGAGEVVRVFSDNTPSTGLTVILGLEGVQGATSFTLPESDPNHDVDMAALRLGDVSLWVEGRLGAGEVKLSIALHDATGAALCSDDIQLKVAPFIMLPNTAAGSRVLVSNMDPAFHGAITSLAGAANVITIPVVDANDQWPQDAWEFGFSSAPGGAGSMPVAFETLRQGKPLENWGCLNLLGPTPNDPERTGLIVRLASEDDPLAYGGNLEVTPPLPGHPLGRIVVGTMPAVQTAFLDSQQVQTPLIQLDTTWLRVGHIDEFMAFLPGDPGTDGRLVLSSPTIAFGLLDTVPEWEPLFYCGASEPVFHGEAGGGSFGHDRTGGPPSGPTATRNPMPPATGCTCRTPPGTSIRR